MIGHALRLDEELIRVPLIVKSAHGVRLPSHYTDQLQLTNVFPLALELARHWLHGPSDEQFIVHLLKSGPRPLCAFHFDCKGQTECVGPFLLIRCSKPDQVQSRTWYRFECNRMTDLK
jgi:hypothetical protein